MRWSVLSVFFAAVYGSAFFAQENSKDLKNCLDKAAGQQEMTVCAGEEVMRAEADLNEVYEHLITRATPDAIGVRKLDAARKAWAVYRDAYIEALYPAENKQAAYGSIFAMEVRLVRATLTRQHADQMRVLLKR